MTTCTTDPAAHAALVAARRNMLRLAADASNARNVAEDLEARARGAAAEIDRAIRGAGAECSGLLDNDPPHMVN